MAFISIYLCFNYVFIQQQQKINMSIHVNMVVDEIHCEILTLSSICLFKHGKLHRLSQLVSVVLISETHTILPRLKIREG